jgi:hypothetical protein
MKRMIIGFVSAAVVLATVAVGTAVAKKPPGPQTTGKTKVWICHKTSSKTNPYVAIRIPVKQVTTHTGFGASASAILAGVPQTASAARAFCRAQRLLTPTSGGTAMESTLTSSAPTVLNGTGLALHARLGQGQVCLSATLTTTPAGGTVTVSSVTLQQGTGTPTTLNLTPALPQTGTSPFHLAGCATLDRAIVKALLKGTTSFTLTITTTTPAATLTATFGS